MKEKIKRIRYGLAEENTILAIWDRKHGEVYAVPAGIEHGDLVEFFEGLAARIAPPETRLEASECDESCRDCEVYPLQDYTAAEIKKIMSLTREPTEEEVKDFNNGKIKF